MDGGGTRTRAALVDEAGRLLGYGASTASNPKAVGLDGAVRAVEEAVSHACAPLPLRDGISAAFFAGLAGVRTAHDASAVEATLRTPIERLGFGNLSIGMGGDIQNALAGALGGEPGIVLIVGTGSAAYGRNEAGEARQAGGWGWFIDDPGSGYWLGYQAMRAAARSHDGRGRVSSLEESVRAFLRIKTIHEMPNIIYNPHFSRERVAELAPILFKAAAEGDAVAISILEEGFRELALMVTTVARELRMPRARVSAVGGVADSGPLFSQRLQAAIHAISPGLDLVPARVAPVVGAVILAFQSQGRALSDEALRRLDEDVAAEAGRLARQAAGGAGAA